MNKEIPISTHRQRRELRVHTLGRYAMGVAVETLEFLNKQVGVSVKSTGWKQGFGLQVASWVPIYSQNLAAELQTDGDEFVIRLVSGSQREFEVLIDMVCQLLE